jgi:hypothetical protein
VTKYIKPANRVMDIAWLRDGSTVHTGEALLLACLLRVKGKSRRSEAMKDVQRIMKDVNYVPPTDSTE